MPRTVLVVFLSSTAMDLAAHRKAVHKELTATKHFQCVWQEDFGAQDAGAVEFCRQEVQKADLFIGLVGLRRGWEPDGDNAKRSITEMEHDWAREAGRRRFLWVTPDDLPLAGSLRESDEQHGRQVAFRGRVKGAGERIVSQMGFDSPELLAAKILNHLLVHVLTSDLITQLRPEFARQSGDTVEDHAPAIAAAVERLAEDDDVDLLTLAKDPKGVDLVELETKLRTRAETHEAAGQRERKTSAEYWRHVGALAFLRDTRRALMAYEKAVALDSDEPESWGHLGELQCRLGDLTAAEKTFERQVALGASTGNLKAQAMGQLGLGWIFLDRGDLASGEECIKASQLLADNAHWSEGVARAWRNLGNLNFKRGELVRAEEMQLAALRLEEELGNREGTAAVSGNLGVIHSTRGDLNNAEKLLLAALKLYQELDQKEGLALTYGKSRGRLSDARRPRQGRGNAAPGAEARRGTRP